MPSITFERFTDPDAPILPLQEHSEFSRLLGLYCTRQPRRVLEIGTYRGGTLYQWMKHSLHNTEFTIIDLPGARWGGMNSWNPELWGQWADTYKSSLTAVLSSSHDPRAIEAARGNAPYDFIFIDGDHSYSGAKSDFETYSKLAAPGAIVVFHDIVKHHDIGVGVWQLWQELKKTHETDEFISHKDQRHMGIGVVYL